MPKKNAKDGAKDTTKDQIIARVKITGVAASKDQEKLVPQLRDARQP